MMKLQRVSPAAIPRVAKAALGQATSGTGSKVLASRRLIGNYDGELRRSDGRVDIPLLIRQLQGLMANVYLYLIWHAETDWEDLRRFLPEAGAAGMEVWAYLVPPSESPPRTTLFSEPFRLDYIRWGEEIGKLSAEHPNLTAFVIDDFFENARFFTPEYVRQMRAAGRRHNPGLLFLPLMYYPEIDHTFVAGYREVIDGVVAAYPKGPEDIRSARAYLTDRYESPTRWIFTYPGRTPSEAEGFAEVRRTYAVSPADRYALRLTVEDNYRGSAQARQQNREARWKQVLVDGNVVWEEDVAAGAEGPRTVRVDVTSQAKGKDSVSVVLRAADRRSVTRFRLKVSWSEPEGDGLRPADGSDWTSNTQGRWQASFEAAYRGTGACYLPLVVMVAASRGEFPQRLPLPATPENIRDHLKMAFEEWAQGHADGVVTYVLDKSPGNPDYAAVQPVFARAARTRGKR
jgi:hypothetical protein